MPPVRTFLILTAIALLPWRLPAEDSKPDPAEPTASSPVKPAPGKPVYKPPMLGAPAVRVGGASRGGGSDASVVALVPDHAGLTTKAQPSLFWYQSKPAKARLEITLVEPKKVEPLAHLQSPTANKAGIQRLNLAKYKIELQPNVSYKWSVALVSDEQNRSKDVVASGVIKRVAKSDELSAKLKAASPAERPFILAEAGIWYDALEEISDLIESNPKEAAFRNQRAALLQQVGLSQAADTAKEKTAGRD